MATIAISPTIYLIGINRSGTTAITQSFLNNPTVEVFKDPGKYLYESTGNIDFSHFFAPPLNNNIKSRFIKQSIGQYTADLCTIPLFPVGKNKTDLIRSLKTVFLIREPIAVWKSWESMTAWIRNSNEKSVVEKWAEIENDYGIPKGWGDSYLLTLCYQYLFSVYSSVSYIAPKEVTILVYEEWIKKPYEITNWLCDRAGIPFCKEMIDWNIQFGGQCDRLVSDGFSGYGDLNSKERAFIHRSIHNSKGLKSCGQDLLCDDREPAPALDEANRIYEKLSELFHLQYRDSNPC